MKQNSTALDAAARDAQAVRMMYPLHDVHMVGGWGVIGTHGAGWTPGAGRGFGIEDDVFAYEK